MKCCQFSRNYSSLYPYFFLTFWANFVALLINTVWPFWCRVFVLTFPDFDHIKIVIFFSDLELDIFIWNSRMSMMRVGIFYFAFLFLQTYQLFFCSEFRRLKAAKQVLIRFDKKEFYFPNISVSTFYLWNVKHPQFMISV